MKSKKLLKLLMTILPAVMLLILGVGVLSKTLFDKIDFLTEIPRPNFLESIVAMRKLQAVLPVMANAGEDEVAELRFTETEFNSVMMSLMGRCSMIGAFGRAEDLKKHALLLRKGTFQLMRTDIAGFGTPFGSIVNSIAEFHFRIRNGADEIQIRSASAGRLSIPSALVQMVLNAVLRKNYRGTGYEKLVKNSIESLEATPEGVAIRYRPGRLMKSLDELTGQNLSERIRTLYGKETK